jgi:hypothetical protein
LYKISDKGALLGKPDGAIEGDIQGPTLGMEDDTTDGHTFDAILGEHDGATDRDILAALRIYNNPRDPSSSYSPHS